MKEGPTKAQVPRTIVQPECRPAAGAHARPVPSVAGPTSKVTSLYPDAPREWSRAVFFRWVFHFQGLWF